MSYPDNRIWTFGGEQEWRSLAGCIPNLFVRCASCDGRGT